MDKLSIVVHSYIAKVNDKCPLTLPRQCSSTNCNTCKCSACHSRGMPCHDFSSTKELDKVGESCTKAYCCIVCNSLHGCEKKCKHIKHGLAVIENGTYKYISC